jgi:hypothetical protein
MVRRPGVGVARRRARRRRASAAIEASGCRRQRKASGLLFWLFGLLGAMPGDSLDDLYPGSGIVSWAWQRWTGVADEELVTVPAVGAGAVAGVQEAS